jgi:hypothetical protein
MPQAPQLRLSELTSTHPAPQGTVGGAQAELQTPALQTSPLAQARSHAPQCAGSLATAAQTPPQLTPSFGQVQMPPMQVVPDGHTLPHPPQCAGSDDVSTQLRPHFVAPPQPDAQRPLAQT